MTRWIVTLMCVIIFGCSTPTLENRCCTDGTCGISYTVERALCLEKFTDSLEKELEMQKLKMHYECKEAK